MTEDKFKKPKLILFVKEEIFDRDGNVIESNESREEVIYDTDK